MSLGIASTPEMKTRVQHHMAQLRGALTSSLSGKIYMNFVMGDEARSRTREGYSEKAYQRLQEIKQRYDPDHLMDYSYEF